MPLSPKQHNARTPCMLRKLRKSIKQRKLQSTLVILKSRKTFRNSRNDQNLAFLCKKKRERKKSFLNQIWLDSIKEKCMGYLKSRFTCKKKSTGLAQCPRTDLNKSFLPRPKTTTAWKLIPHSSKISKNWNPPPWERFY